MKPKMPITANIFVKMWRIVLVIFCLVMHTLPFNAQTVLHGSSAVAFITPSEIAVASDSRAMNFDGSVSSQVFCKIKQVNNVFFVAANLVSVLEVKYDAYSIFAHVGSSEGDISEKAKRMEDEIVPALTKALNLIRQVNVKKYVSDYEGKKAFSFILFGIQKGTPTLALRSFKAFSSAGSNSVSIIVERNDCPSPNCPAVAAAYIGRTDSIEKFLAEHPRIGELPPVEAARFLVTLAAIDYPDVGLPIDIVRLDRMGAQWIQRRPECEEKK